MCPYTHLPEEGKKKDILKKKLNAHMEFKTISHFLYQFTPNILCIALRIFAENSQHISNTYNILLEDTEEVAEI